MHPHTLVQNLHEMVQIQFIDIKKAFAGEGTFYLRMEDPPVANSENLDQLYTDFLKGDLPCDSYQVKERRTRRRLSRKLASISLGSLGCFVRTPSKGFLIGDKAFTQASRPGKRRNKMEKKTTTIKRPKMN